MPSVNAALPWVLTKANMCRDSDSHRGGEGRSGSPKGLCSSSLLPRVTSGVLSLQGKKDEEYWTPSHSNVAIVFGYFATVMMLYISLV